MPESEVVPDPTYDASRPQPNREILYQYPLVNVPGKTLIGVRVTLPPNGATPPHRHGGASVVAHLLNGNVLNKMNNLPTCVMRTSESWYEAPGCHHRVCENVSKTEEAVFLATFVIDSDVFEKGGMAALVQVDEEFRVG